MSSISGFSLIGSSVLSATQIEKTLVVSEEKNIEPIIDDKSSANVSVKKSNEYDIIA